MLNTIAKHIKERQYFRLENCKAKGKTTGGSDSESQSEIRYERSGVINGLVSK